MPKHVEKEDFQLESGEKVFTFEALMAAKANLDNFEKIGVANDATDKSLKGEPLIQTDKANFANREIYRRKTSGKIGRELIK